jgi:RNA polymerase sigma-70 factor (ECF subfamily)
MQAKRPVVSTPLASLVDGARQGDLDACAALVRATHLMVYAVAVGVLRDHALAEDASQEAYIRAFRRLRELEDAAAFPGWLRRIVITVALNMRRARRRTLLCLEDLPETPILDEAEHSWSEWQRRRLAGALLALTPVDRRLCDRRYHGGWSVARLARDAGVDEPTMRKRLQRVRDKLRKEIEMAEQRGIAPERLQPDLPAKVVELLARPQLTDLPENPVGRVLEMLQTVFADLAVVRLPEVVDFAEARKTVGDDALYVGVEELHRVDEGRILRYDLTLPLLLTIRYEGKPLFVRTAGKTYRRCELDAMHLEAFHQAELFWMDGRSRLDAWKVTALVLQSIDHVLPGRVVKIVPTRYPMCTQAWELEVEDNGSWFEVLAWGVFNDKIVRHLGGDPARHTAIGAGYGLERLAMLRYGIDDIRKIDVASVA